MELGSKALLRTRLTTNTQAGRQAATSSAPTRGQLHGKPQAHTEPSWIRTNSPQHKAPTRGQLHGVAHQAAQQRVLKLVCHRRGQDAVGGSAV